MKIEQFEDNTHVMSFRVYDEDDKFLGWTYYLKVENCFRYTVSGPIGTHEKVHKLVLDYLAEKELLDL